MRVLELFCGIGGCAAALDGSATVVAAVDVNRLALECYALNFPHPVVAKTIESLPIAWFRDAAADLWWLSPPCQPYTQQGARRDEDDPRATSLRHVLEAVAVVCPRWIALENVPGFCGSRMHARVRSVLASAGYEVRERLLCPTELGWANRRLRFYLLAGRTPLPPWPEPNVASNESPPLDTPEPELWLTPAEWSRWSQGVHVVDEVTPVTPTRCFTSSYGRSLGRSGSLLRTANGVRRFSPAEIARQLGFPPQFRLPDRPARELWPLVGNSLSVPAVRHIVAISLREMCLLQTGVDARGSSRGA